MSKQFQPDYTNILKVLHNQRPGYLPLYEHHIDPPFISKALGEDVSSEGLNDNELEGYYRKIIAFWKEMNYDAFNFEAAICSILPGHGALMGSENTIVTEASTATSVAKFTGSILTTVGGFGYSGISSMTLLNMKGMPG